MAEANVPSVPTGSLVLVTGVTGFIAAHIAKEFLERGYRVVGTVRDLEKASFLTEEVFPDYAERGALELVTVPDLGAPNAFDSVIKGKGIAIIVHVASPLTFDPDPNNTIPQTINATKGLLRAAARESSMKQFVYTSSAPVAILGAPGDQVHSTKETWNTYPIEAAWAPPPYEPARGGMTYLAGKAEAEMAMWKFSAEQKPGFDVNSVLPFTTMGKGLAKYHLRGTASWMRTLYDGQPGMMNVLPQMCYVNVRDVAALHVAAALDPDLKGERLFGWVRPITINNVLDTMRQMYPDHEFIQNIPDKVMAGVTKDDSLERSLLKKWTGRDDWISLEETIRDGMEEVV